MVISERRPSECRLSAQIIDKRDWRAWYRLGPSRGPAQIVRFTPRALAHNGKDAGNQTHTENR
jgi:hypothetical protein